MSTECLIKRFGLTLEEAKNRIFLMPLMATSSIPIYSFLAGRYGKKSLLLVIGCCLGIASFVIMLNLPISKSDGNDKTKSMLYICVFLLSQFRSIASSIMYSAIALASPVTTTAIAFGLT